MGTHCAGIHFIYSWYKRFSSFYSANKRINFAEERVIDQNAKVLEEICRKHNRDMREARVDTQEADAKGDLVSGQESIIRKTKEQIEEIKDKFALDRKQIGVAPEEKTEKADTFQKIEKKFVSMLDNMAGKFMLYYAFIHALKPFYLDRRGDKSVVLL